MAGIYDGPEMNNVVRDWQRAAPRAAPGSPAAQHLALWETIAPRLVAKASEPLTAQGPHNFMHNKVVVADGTTDTSTSRVAAGWCKEILFAWWHPGG